MKNFLLSFFFIFSLSAAEFSTFFSPEDDLIQVVLNVLNKANRSIDIAIYSFDSKKVRSMLEQKLEQGVKLRLIIRPSTVKRALEFVESLKERGAEVRYLTKTNHHKFLIVDQKWLLSSSGNFSDSKRAASYDENMIVCLDCYDYLAPYREEFEFLYRHATDLHLKMAPDGPEPSLRSMYSFDTAFMTSQNFTPYYKKRSKRFHFHTTSEKLGAVESRLIDIIDNAQSSLLVATGHLRSWNLYKALRRAALRGVKVDLLLDSQEYVSTQKEKYLVEKVKECKKTQSDSYCRSRGLYYGRKAMKAGINVYIKYYSFIWDFIISPQMHHKYMIVDDQTLYTGSYNWSANAEFNSFENVTVIDDYATISSFKDNFDKILQYGRGGFEQLKESLKNSSVNLPLHFDPITLPMKKVDELYKVACSKCPEVFCKSDSPIDELEDHEDNPVVLQYIFKMDGKNYCTIH
jgi:phosphatidylserine/phosphatidylglycerophosphate/cardiolipin synthase-like enzyme